MCDGLLCLKRNGLHHGFVMPENILMYNLISNMPNFKLLDVKILSGHKSCYERMVTENDYFAPLDQQLLKNYSVNNPVDEYSFENDIWSLGISTLCYIFYEDFHIFYDWNARQVRTAKI